MNQDQRDFQDRKESRGLQAPLDIPAQWDPLDCLDLKGNEEVQAVLAPLETRVLQALQDSLDLLGLRALKGTLDQRVLLVPKATRASKEHQVSQGLLEHLDLLAKVEERVFQDSREKKEMMAFKALRGQQGLQGPVVHQG